jgi:hypothetical protein
MCVIAFKPKNSVLTKEDANLMWEANSHGAGFCVWDEKSRTWKMKKGFMKFEALWNEVEPYTKEGSILVVHFRIVSRGTVCPEQTHPFEIALEEGTAYLFHNGTLDIEITQGSSDTYELAYQLSQLGLKKEKIKLLLEGGLLERVRGHSRFAVCFPDEEEPFLVGRWEEIRGLKTSNSSWEFGKTYTGFSGRKGSVFQPYYASPYWEEEWEERKLPFCGCDPEEDHIIVEAGELRFKVEGSVAYPYFGKESPVMYGELIVGEDGFSLLVEDELSYSYIYEIKPRYNKDPVWAIDEDGHIYRLDHYRVVAFPAGRKHKNTRLPKETAIAIRVENTLYVLDKLSLAIPYEIKEGKR